MNYFAIYAAAGVGLVTALALNVSRIRIREKVGNGDGGVRSLRRAIRAHMNAVEHIAPFGLVVLALAAIGAPDALEAAIVFGMLGSRALHAAGMLVPVFRLRQLAAALTYAVEVIGCVAVGVLLAAR